MHRVAFVALCALCVVSATPAFLSNSAYGTHLPLNKKFFDSALSSLGYSLEGKVGMVEIRRTLIEATLTFGEQVLTDPKHAAEVAHVMRKHFPDAAPTAEQVSAKVKQLIHTHSAEEVLAADGVPTLSSDQFPYFGFIPPLQGAAVPDQAPVKFSSPCWKTVTAGAVSNADGSVTLTITVDDQVEPFCSDHFLLGTVAALQIGVEIGDKGAHTFTWKADPTRTASETWDLMNKGIRIYRFGGGAIETVVQIVDTALLFLGEIFNPVPSSGVERNVYFMKYYANVDMLPRKTQVVELDESTIHSGDFFGILRFDGLDPMLAWAMGSTTGHTTIALRDELTNELYITESTVNDVYWPTNGIQKTPWKTWFNQTITAGFNAVHAPLTAEARAKFNVTKAWQWFNATEGFEYGFHNMLWGWVDTPKENYPCVPPYPSETCLEWSHVEVLFAVINRYIPALGDLLFTQAWNLRLGTKDLPPADLYQLAAQKNMSSADIPAIVEQDSWVYNMTRNGKPSHGPSSVCCVHVCRMWKAAGVFDSFDSEVNCAELTNWDDYALTIFEAHPQRQQACIDADPDNVLCQFVGAYTLHLNNYASKAPYAHMAEKCPSEAPNYSKPANC